MNEKFNITVNYSCPEADADSRLNLMISSDDLPDVIIMDRNANWQKLISLGKLVDINTLRYEGLSLIHISRPPHCSVMKQAARCTA